ncbi:NADP-dependent oxidoreductase [Actinomadura parmotrematis]|uniref:NADP-dependent oxidoreductase n=1 Tax=Actinomadura parmotrematis TaxID=2864039 RepID=A0ABS7FV66_9ACTN|nr:NADP-dependent oxidoreductase [Actinomadura parmotrematis]
MRAIGVAAPGGPEVLREIEIERPEPGPGEVLVRVRAAGVNPTDWKHRAGGGLLAPPFVPGWDVSGVVEAAGPGAGPHRPGDEVFGMLPYPHGAGAYAEYVAAPARTFVRKPANLDHVQAAALPLAALTAWQALVDAAGLRAGQRVLIHAAAGGVGHLAVQIAKARGAHVTGTARAAKHPFLKELGADEAIDYTAVDFADAARDMDVVLDTIGGDYGPRSLRTLRPGGTLVWIVLSRPFDGDATGFRTERVLVEPDHAALSAIAGLAAEGRLRAAIDGVLPLADAARAHELGETGRVRGKLVLTVAD